MNVIVLVDDTRVEVDHNFYMSNSTIWYTTYVESYSELEKLSKKLTADNMKYITHIEGAERMDDPDSEIDAVMTRYGNMTISTPKFHITEKSGKLEVVFGIQPITEEEQYQNEVEKAINLFTDEQALSMKNLYPTFNQIIGRTVDAGTRFVYEGLLYKTLQPELQITVDRAPRQGTESLYVCMEENHTGSFEDSIPYDGNMVLENGKYYTQEDIKYVCIRGSENPVYHPLKYLMGIYVAVAPEEIVDDTVPEDGAIQYQPPMELVEGKQYIQDGVKYQCTRGSEAPLVHDLKDLVDLYVTIVE